MLERRDFEASETSLGSISVGGFVYQRARRLNVPYVGVFEGRTDDAARRVAYSAVPADVIARWATEQARLIDVKKFLKSQLLNASQRIITAGGDPCALPYCFVEGALIDYETAKRKMKASLQVYLPLKLEYSRFAVHGYDDITSIYFDLPLKKEMFVLAGDKTRLLEKEISALITKNELKEISLLDLKLGASLSVFLDTLKKVWGCEPRLSIEEAQLFLADLHTPPPLRWVLALRQPT
jgi:hypothetical protein